MLRGSGGEGGSIASIEFNAITLFLLTLFIVVFSCVYIIIPLSILDIIGQ